MQPDAAGINGSPPVLKSFPTFLDEVSHLTHWVKNEYSLGVSWDNIAVLCPSKAVRDSIEAAFSKNEIPYKCLFTSTEKKKYSTSDKKVSVLAVPSSKGLEFHSVAVIDSSTIINKSEDISDEVRRLYVGFTRATRNLLVTWHTKNSLSECLEKISI